MDLGLKNKVAVVVGGANGIGWAVSQLLAAEGCDVAIWDIAEIVADRSRELSESNQIRSFGSCVDITDVDSVHAALDATTSELGSVGIVVHAAAIGSGKFGFPFLNLETTDWKQVIDVNVQGMVNVAHVMAEHMIANDGSSMVFVASVAGQIGSPTDPPYSASKAANINFAQCMARDLAAHDIRVNTVCPGMVKTKLNRSVWQSWHDQAPESERLSYEDWADSKVKNLIPLGRWQTAEDIANLVAFLSSDRATNITGQTMNVDGGYVMHW